MSKGTGQVLAWVGVVLVYLGNLVAVNAESGAWIIVWLIGVVLLLGGCWGWATGKGRSGAYMLLGLIAPLGFIGLAVLKDKKGE